MMPYLYSAVREATVTGMPVIRAMWLHYPDDPAAVSRGDQYLWGRDVLVAPVVEQGATSRKLYLPRGNWYDFWTNERIEGGQEMTRKVDLETIPLGHLDVQYSDIGAKHGDKIECGFAVAGGSKYLKFIAEDL